MKLGDVVRFKEPAQRTEGEQGVVIDDSPSTPWVGDFRYVEVYWPSGSRILEDKGMLEIVEDNEPTI